MKKKGARFFGFSLGYFTFYGFCFLCRPPGPLQGRTRLWGRILQRHFRHLLTQIIRSLDRKPRIQLVLLLVLSRHYGISTHPRRSRRRRTRWSPSGRRVREPFAPLLLHRLVVPVVLHTLLLVGGSITELDPRPPVLLLGTRAPRATRRNLPEPRVVVHDLDLLAIKKPLADTPTLGVHPVPLLEMDKNTLVKIPVVGLPFHHVDAVDRSQLKLIHHLLHKTLCDVREHTGDAQRRLRALDIAERRHFELSFNFSRRTTYLFIYFQ